MIWRSCSTRWKALRLSRNGVRCLSTSRTPPEARAMILNSVRNFVVNEVEPVACQHDREDTIPHGLINRMKELGLFGLNVPEEYGGVGVDCTTFASIFEELSKGLMSLTGVIGTHHILTYVLNHWGTDEQKWRFLPDLAAGRKRGGLALTEPSGGTDVANLRTTATKQNNGDYLVNGTKMFITNGRHGDTFCLLARTNPSTEPRHKGLSCFIVEKGGPGFEVGRDLDKLGYRGVDTCELIFNNHKVPAENLIGEEGSGFGMVMSGLETGRINVGARAVGMAQAAFDSALRYSKMRESFGKPISEHQAIQSKLATMATKIQAARLLVYDAAEKKDNKARTDLESGMAKLFASEMCLEVTLEAMRIHGGYGYIKGSPVERYYRDAPLLAIGEGTNEVLQQVIAKQLLRRSET